MGQKQKGTLPDHVEKVSMLVEIMTSFTINRWFPTLCCILFIMGCATKQDLRRVQGGLDQKITVTSKDIETLKEENESLRKSNKEAMDALRKSQAEINADMTELKDRIQQLTGKSDEQRKDLSSLSVRANHKDEEVNDLKEKLERTSFKINFVENFLGLSKKDGSSEISEKAVKSTNGQQKEAQKGKTGKEAAYAAAYETFKEGKYEKARIEFQNFLKQYPKTEYSANAQFWIGECYYLDQKYEKAILEYEKVVKNYPDGNKVPYALLKQGLSFQKLGDKTSARLILQQVIRDYPNTNQARVARATLLEIK
jgi:tol-pal system protein YbgF